MRFDSKKKHLLLAATFILTVIVYWPGLSGAFVFDDYPNIVDNQGVQPKNASLSSLVSAALSSPSSDLSRPLASLSFAANYLITGLNPYWMKFTNLVIHLLNGLLIYLLARALMRSAEDSLTGNIGRHAPASTPTRIDLIAALITASWMLLPINLTAVLYIVQRMESMANLFVLLGLIGYVAGRRRMLMVNSVISNPSSPTSDDQGERLPSSLNRGLVLCIISIIVPTVIGVLAKETAVLLPLYALMIEWVLFQFQSSRAVHSIDEMRLTNPSAIIPITPLQKRQGTDRRVIVLFLLVLVLPMLIGVAWLLPKVLNPQSWSTRDFTLSTRLLSEARILVDYIIWTLLPTPHELAFYHDDFVISSGLLMPWTTLLSILILVGLVGLVLWLRRRRPLVALGIGLFLSCHLLTGTILPLELIYEHRNYFASFGLLLATVSFLAAPPRIDVRGSAEVASSKGNVVQASPNSPDGLLFPRLRYALLAGLLLCWTALTAFTACAWGNPLRLAEDLAIRATGSPRAQYELGRTYIILSNYDASSPFTRLAYATLERAAALPNSSILPEQAMIFMNARMHLPLKDAWWNSLIAKLRVHTPTVQDESSLASLTLCARDHECNLPEDRMSAAFNAALSHPNSTGRLLANYGDYAWNLLGDKQLGLKMARAAVLASPNEPAYRITLTRMLVVLGRFNEANQQIAELNRLNYGGRLNTSLTELRALPGLKENETNKTKNI
jgi:protein O-mannosyl-transferase